MEIRIMKESEFERVCELANSSKFTKDLPYVTRKWHGENNIRVLLQDGNIAAYAYYVITKYRDYVNLYWIGTAKEHMGKGFAKTFILHMCKEALKSGKEYLHFSVNKRNEAKGFYDKLGLQHYAETDREFKYRTPLKHLISNITI